MRGAYVIVHLLLTVAQDRAADSTRISTRVTLPSDGGWVLVGDYTRPRTPDRVPAVLLLHGAVRDRRAYIPLAQELAKRGVAALRLDLRGEGESTNLGRFEPGSRNATLAGAEHDVATALRWLARQPGIDTARIGVLGASYSGEAMARAARIGSPAAAYVALSPGDFSDTSARAIDAAGRPWWFIAAADERFAHVVVRAIPTMSRTARTTLVEGTSHASDILSPHHFLNQEIADWFAAHLAGRTAPEAWGGLQPGAYDVGFRRDTIRHDRRAVVVDTWYPARAAGRRLRFEDYLRLSTDLRGAVDRFPSTEAAVASTLSNAISGQPDGVPPDTVRRILRLEMAAAMNPPPADGRFPLVLWTPRYATTVAQSTMSEHLASLGFVVAFARPATGGRLPFELPTAAAKVAELHARVADMRAAIAHLEARAQVDASRIGVVAWSYTGEMATRLQLLEPRVALVAGLSTTLLGDRVFQPPADAELDVGRLTAAYAILTQRGATPAIRPPALDGIPTGYFIEFPGLAHGSFNALEGYLPSRFGVERVQRWSLSSPAGATGYEAMAVLLSRLLRAHVEVASSRPVARVPLSSGIPAGVAEIRSPPAAPPRR